MSFSAFVAYIFRNCVYFQENTLFWGGFAPWGRYIEFGNWDAFGATLVSLWPSWDTCGVHLERLGPQGVHVGVPEGARPDLGTSRALKYCKYQQDLRFWNSRPERPQRPQRPERRKWCQKRWLGPHLPRTPGARMTEVTQTPSNYINIV